ncbi:Platinum sensitivity protein [Podila epigama]|nr:Platinum sensitivity protein [Podila epigama]
MELVFDVDDFDGRTSSDIITTTSIPVLPPELIRRCLQYLPISSLTAVAMACRRLKVIVYSDELWESKLLSIGYGFGNKNNNNNTDGSHNNSLLDGPIDSLPRFPVHSTNASETTRQRLAANASEAIKGTGPTPPNNKNKNRDSSLSNLSDDSQRISIDSVGRIQIPGLPGDPYSMIQGRKAHQGAREQFKAIYSELWPYYVDFRHSNRDSKVIQEFGKSVLDVARMLARLQAFSKGYFAEDSDQINENLQGTCEYFENRCLHLFEVAYDSRDIPEMAKFAGVLLDLNGAAACIQIFIQKNGIFFDNNYEPSENLKQYEIWFAQPLVVRENSPFPEFEPLRLFMEFTEMELQKQGIIVHDVFPEEADVLYSFTERVFEDVISEYCSQLFDMCSMRDKLLYLKSVPTAYRFLEKLEHTLTTMEPMPLPRYRVEKLLARVFAPWLEQYLKQELDWVQKSCKDRIDKYDRQRDSGKSEPKRMNPRNREIFKRNFMKGFRTVLTLPYKISSSIVAGVTQSTSSSSATTTPSSSTAATSSASLPPTAPTTSTAARPKSNRFSIRSITSLSGSNSTVSASAPSTPTASSQASFAPDSKATSIASDTDSIKSAPGGVENTQSAVQQQQQAVAAVQQEIEEEMNSLLSVELALHLIHLDKDALQRLSAFAGLGGVLGGRVTRPKSFSPPSMDPQAKMRVKVYHLRTGNQWIDQGTGHCSYEFNHEKSEGSLIVHSEEDEEKVLLNSLIRYGEELYQRQHDTLIVWSEEEGLDLALSFQEVEGCGEIWDNIQEIQQQYAEGLFSDRSDLNVIGLGDAVTLPDPEMSNLTEIETTIKEAQGGLNEKEKLASFIVTEKYISKLFPVFETCEDLESIEDLHTLHDIMLGIILLNDQPLIEYIISDENIINSVGMLEYDPELGNEKENYRDFLQNKAKYKEIVPINNLAIETKIHEIFRAIYLRDTVLTRIMDEALQSTFTSILFFHNIEIVNYIHQDRQFQTSLFEILNDASSSLERKRDVVMFVQQFCSIAKTTQMPARVGLYRTLSQTGLFNIFELALSDTEPKIKMAGAEILLSAMEHDPNLVRSYIVKQSEDKEQRQLMDIILDQLLVEKDVGIQLQYSEVLRVLLDTNPNQMEGGMQLINNNSSHDPDADKFLDLFYETYIGKFVSPLLELSEDTLEFDRPQASMYEIICQIMTFLVRSHTFRSKYYVLSCGMVPKVCILFKNQDQHLKLCALRFFRMIIGQNDDFYNRYLVKHNVVQHIVDLLLSTNNRNNLLNSACIEFFEYIRHSNNKLLISHIVSMHGERLKQIQYVDTFKQLIRRYEQHQDRSMSDSQTNDASASEAESAKHSQSRPHDGWSSTTVDDDEEAYFNNSDDEEEAEDDIVEDEKSNEPSVSDLRKRVREDSDDSDDEDSATSSDMDRDPEPDRPMLRARKSLVDYDEEEDEDGAFGQLVTASTASSLGSTKSDSSSPPPSPPPSKKCKLDDEAESDADSTATDTSDNESSSSPKKQDGSIAPIKFVLNAVRNGRSSSPLSSSAKKAVKPRSVSPMSSSSSTSSSSSSSSTSSSSSDAQNASQKSSTASVTTRTGKVFVKAGSEARDENGGPKLSSLEESTSEAASHLRSDLATEFKLVPGASGSDDTEEESRLLNRNGNESRNDPVITPVSSSSSPTKPTDEAASTKSPTLPPAQVHPSSSATGSALNDLEQVFSISTTSTEAEDSDTIIASKEATDENELESTTSGSLDPSPAS